MSPPLSSFRVRRGLMRLGTATWGSSSSAADSCVDVDDVASYVRWSLAMTYGRSYIDRGKLTAVGFHYTVVGHPVFCHKHFYKSKIEKQLLVCWPQVQAKRKHWTHQYTASYLFCKNRASCVCVVVATATAARYVRRFIRSYVRKGVIDGCGFFVVGVGEGNRCNRHSHLPSRRSCDCPAGCPRSTFAYIFSGISVWFLAWWKHQRRS